MQDRGHRGTPVCVWGAQLVKQSPVMRGGWSGVGGLLTVVASSLQPAPQTQSWGWEGESKKRNTRAKPPPIFIAGVLEICLSLLILGR